MYIRKLERLKRKLQTKIIAKLTFYTDHTKDDILDENVCSQNKRALDVIRGELSMKRQLEQIISEDHTTNNNEDQNVVLFEKASQMLKSAQNK